METFSVIISVLALFISGCAFWRQYMYRSDEVSCVVTGRVLKRWERFCTTGLHIAIGNSGTRSIMLTEAAFELRLSTGDSHVGTNKGTGMDVVLPVLIDAGSILKIYVSQTLQDETLMHFRDNYRKGFESGVLGPFDFSLTLQFVTVAGDEIRFCEPVATLKLRESDGSNAEMVLKKIRPWKLSRRVFLGFAN